MINPAEVADYNIKRFKEIVSSTNNLIILFVFTLFYVWYQSINPNLEILYRYQEEYRKFGWINNSLIHSLELRRDTFNTQYRSFHQPNDSIKANNINKRIRFYDSVTKRIDSISDTLQNKVRLKIDIPTLSSVDFPLRIGLIVWMLLFLFFVGLIYKRRKTAIFYLIKGLYNYREKLTANNYNLRNLDVSIPFWMGPIEIEGDQYLRRVMYVVVEWSYKQKLFLAGLILMLALLLLRVWWTSLNINNGLLLNDSKRVIDLLILTILGNVMLVIPILIITKWISNPLKVKIK